METIAILEKNKKYVIVRIPRSMMRHIDARSGELSEQEALKVLRDGMREYRARKTKPLRTLRDLRYGN